MINLICGDCGKDKVKLEFKHKNNDKNICYKCAFKYQLKLDKNIFITCKKFINLITFKHQRRIHGGYYFMLLVFIAAWLLFSTYINIKDFSFVNLINIVALMLFIKSEV